MNNEPKTDPPSIIRVDHLVRPVYPDSVKKVVHPELENLGPTEFDANKLELWVQDGQKGNKAIQGHKIYEHLKENKMLEGCLGLRDLEEIQKKGIDFFRRFFRGKVVFAWKSVVLYHRYNELYVPCLAEAIGMVLSDWVCLDSYWDSNGPALRLAS